MKVYKYILLITFSIFYTILSSQNLEKGEDAKINIEKQVKLITIKNGFKVYRIKDYLNRNSPVVKRHKRFFINIPQKLDFVNYRYKGKVGKYLFSDSTSNLVVEVYYKNINTTKLTVSKYLKTQINVIDTLPRFSTNKIHNGLYYGVLTDKRKILFYYNVKDNEVELFNKSLRSIRAKKSN